MSAPQREIEGHHLQLLHGLLPRESAPSGRQHRIEHQKANKWRQDTQEPATVELAHRHAALHRHQQECRDNHEQRHGDTSEETIIDGYPQAVVLVVYLGYRSHVIELLTGVYHHHQQAGNDADVIYKSYSFLCHGFIC